MEDLTEFLKKEQMIQFPNFFLTNKPAERPQFKPDRTLKSIESECQKLQSNIVLLCYESKVDPINQVLPDSPVKPHKFQTPNKKSQHLLDSSSGGSNNDCCMLFWNFVKQRRH